MAALFVMIGLFFLYGESVSIKIEMSDVVLGVGIGC